MLCVFQVESRQKEKEGDPRAQQNCKDRLHLKHKTNCFQNMYAVYLLYVSVNTSTFLWGLCDLKWKLIFFYHPLFYFKQWLNVFNDLFKFHKMPKTFPKVKYYYVTKIVVVKVKQPLVKTMVISQYHKPFFGLKLWSCCFKNSG